MSELESPAKKWVCITPTENIPLREGRTVQIAGHEIAVFNLGDRFLALENKCPHRGGPLADGIIAGNAVVCPLHAWRVDLAPGEVTNQSANAPCVKTFPARTENGVVLLELAVSFATDTKVSANCLASISPGPYLNGTASSEV